MKLKEIRIKNFKALKDVSVPVSDFTVVLGSNGSGKSSILQALHWAIQSARNPAVQTSKPDGGKGVTLSPTESDYIPSPDYKNASFDKPYGNFSNAPRMDVELTADDAEGEETSALIWLRAARNEGTTVHAPSNNALISTIKDRRREFSTYIPGLAGIPLEEEKRSARIVHRQAAAGDANTVLRNLLLLLKSKKSEFGRASALKDVEHFASQVMGRFEISVEFDEEKDFRISATFQTASMKGRDPKLWKPLELAGIGFLQVIQIFAYLIYYRPRLFLVDEPDSHLHPDRQENLVAVLFAASKNIGAQVVLATHSPSVVRALNEEASIIWMRDGKRLTNSSEARKQMGWGLLDKKVLVLSEDKGVAPLKRIISQWPHIERITAVWPLNGVQTLPAAESLAGMRSLFGDAIQLVLHRDGDFLSKTERQSWAKPYDDRSIKTWITPQSDIEACFLNPDTIAKTLGVSTSEAEDLLDLAILETSADSAKDFAAQRAIHRKNEKLRPQGASIPSDETVRDELLASGKVGASRGKTVLKRLRAITQPSHSNSSALGKHCPEGKTVATCLKATIERALTP